MIIDSHCHLKKAFDKGHGEAWLAEAQTKGVERVITVGTSIEDWNFYFNLAKEYQGKIDWTVGIHPCDVNEDWGDDVKAISTYFGTEPEPVAIGEIGLDYFHLSKYPDEAAEQKKLQQEAFKAQLGIAYQLDCPVVIHSRNAFDHCVRMIDESGVNWEKVVFHCFAEGLDEIRTLNERGGRGSFTGILTYKNKSVNPIREAALAQGLNKLMLETDSPFLTPEPLRGNPNQPANTFHIAQYVAGLFEVSFDTICKQTTSNTKAFFGLK